MKKVLTICLVIIMTAALLMSFAACDETPESQSGESSAQGEVSDTASGETSETEDPYFTKYDKNTGFANSDTAIQFKSDSVDIKGDGAAASGTTVTINTEGVYVISGECADGQIIVELQKTEKARLVFNGLKLTSASSAPVYVKSADKVVITINENTENVLTDSSNYTGLNADSEPNACVFSKDDLTLNGTGSLTVNGNYNNGICSKDDLKIVSGNITVNAKNNGLKGNDSVTVKDGVIKVISRDDGIKTTNEIDEEKGIILVLGGTINIASGDDGIQATKGIRILGGKVTVSADGDYTNCNGAVEVAEGCLIKD